jgi:alpha-L-fucosidase
MHFHLVRTKTGTYGAALSFVVVLSGCGVAGSGTANPDATIKGDSGGVSSGGDAAGGTTTGPDGGNLGGQTTPSGGSSGLRNAGAGPGGSGGSVARGGSGSGGTLAGGGSGSGGQASSDGPGKDWGIQAWRQLKYGMFIHYGMSTFDGVELSDGKTPAEKFAPTAQDVDQWVRVAKEAGMKYAVLTAKHVAGFCLWDSKVIWKGAEYSYDVGASPVKTDIVGEFVKACGKYGVVPGIYYCSMDHHNSHATTEWTPQLPYLTAEYFQLMQDHLTELHTRYPSIAITWIDIPRHLDAEQRGILYDSVHQLNPRSLVEFNFGVESRDIVGDYTIDVATQVTWPTDILNSEVSVIKTPFQLQQVYQGKTYELGYESCHTLVGGWFWEPGQSPKSVSNVTGLFNSVSAANGNLLLNVPPDQTGRIPDASVKRLNEIRDALNLDTNTPTGLTELPGQ